MSPKHQEVNLFFNINSTALCIKEVCFGHLTDFLTSKFGRKTLIKCIWKTNKKFVNSFNLILHQNLFMNAFTQMLGKIFSCIFQHQVNLCRPNAMHFISDTFYTLQRNVFYLTSHLTLSCPRVLDAKC